MKCVCNIETGGERYAIKDSTARAAIDEINTKMGTSLETLAEMSEDIAEHDQELGRIGDDLDALREDVEYLKENGGTGGGGDPVKGRKVDEWLCNSNIELAMASYSLIAGKRYFIGDTLFTAEAPQYESWVGPPAGTIFNTDTGIRLEVDGPGGPGPMLRDPNTLETFNGEEYVSVFEVENEDYSCGSGAVITEYEGEDSCNVYLSSHFNMKQLIVTIATYWARAVYVISANDVSRMRNNMAMVYFPTQEVAFGDETAQFSMNIDFADNGLVLIVNGFVSDTYNTPHCTVYVEVHE